MVGVGAATVDGQRHAGRRRRNGVEGEAQAGGAGHVAGHSRSGEPRTVFGPSTAVNELLQVLPPSIEYSTRAPASMPERVSAPLLVIWSVAELPLSFVSATLGATGANRIEREAEAGDTGDVAGDIGLANLNGIETLDRRERIAPSLAAIHRVLDERAHLNAREGQRAVVGDMVARVGARRCRSSAPRPAPTAASRPPSLSAWPVALGCRQHLIQLLLRYKSRQPTPWQNPN